MHRKGVIGLKVVAILTQFGNNKKYQHYKSLLYLLKKHVSTIVFGQIHINNDGVVASAQRLYEKIVNQEWTSNCFIIYLPRCHMIDLNNVWICKHWHIIYFYKILFSCSLWIYLPWKCSERISISLVVFKPFFTMFVVYFPFLRVCQCLQNI